MARTLALALALLAFASPASAQLVGGGMDLRLFRPAVDSKGLFALNGADILGHTDVSFGLVLDGGFGILPFAGFEHDDRVTADEASRRSRLVDHLVTGTLHVDLGLANRLVVGAQLPISIVGGPAVEIPGQYNVGPDVRGLEQQGLADMVVHGKVRLLRPERDPVGLAAIVRVQLPTGGEGRFTGAPGVAIWPELALEWRPHRRVRVAANLGYRAVFGDGATLRVGGRTEPEAANATGARLVDGVGEDLTYDDELTFGAGVGVRASDALELVAEAYGAQVATAFGQSGATSVEALVGMKIFVQHSSFLQIGGGLGLTDGMSAARWRGTVGFVFEPSIGDRDGDGYKDDVDECPDEPEDFDNFADEEGCPDPDNDRDGILDDDDECPLVPEDRDGDADEDGCPEGNEGDRDGDGLLDDVDECPDDPEDLDAFEDQDGCPDEDNDRDGILDSDDMCPDDPEDQDDFQDIDGCPDPDNDGDRILDVDDSCPMDPEEYNDFEDEDGCPDRGLVQYDTEGFILLEKIYFDTDSANIQTRSFPVLDAITAALNAHVEVRRVEIQGHADERGDDLYNIQLTRDRAAAVVEALVQRGVQRARMRSAGYGERCPTDPRSNAEAWERNRRVEVKILETDAGPTGVTVACPAGQELVPED